MRLLTIIGTLALLLGMTAGTTTTAQAQCPLGWTMTTNLIPVKIGGCQCMFNVTWCKRNGLPEYHILSVTPAATALCDSTCWINLTAAQFFDSIRKAVLDVECANYCYLNPGGWRTVTVSHPSCIKKATWTQDNYTACGLNPGKCTFVYTLSCVVGGEPSFCTYQLTHTESTGSDCEHPCERACGTI